MPHLLIARTVHVDGMRLLRERADWTFTILDAPTDAEFMAALPQADAVLLRYQPLTAAHVAAAPRLRMVSRHGVGYDTVDTAALAAHEIALGITPQANASSVAEHTLALLLAVARRINVCNASVREGAWQQGIGTESFFELEGKTALIVGAGRIGRAVADRLRAFDMAVQFYDPLLAPPSPAVNDLPAALGQADVVSLHVPLTETTHHLVDPMQCKRGAIIINTARGGVLDGARLHEALNSGHLYGAGLDVFEQEPPASNQPLLAHSHLVCTPHVASLSDGALRRMACESVQNVLDFFDGCPRPGALVDLNTALKV